MIKAVRIDKDGVDRAVDSGGGSGLKERCV